MTTATDVLPEIEKEVTEPDGQSHYVRKDALARGGVVVALCGKKYVPNVLGEAATQRPLCPECKELMGFLQMMENI